MNITNRRIERDDLLAALISAAYSGHDRTALFSLALTFQVEREFVNKINQIPRLIEPKITDDET